MSGEPDARETGRFGTRIFQGEAQLINVFQNLKLRDKIIAVFAVSVMVVGASTLAVLPRINRTIVDNTKQELVSMTALAGSMVEALFDSAIRNYLRGISETHLNTVDHYYSLYKKGEISPEEAMGRTEALFLSHKIGESGYITAVDISRGEKEISLAVHPFTKGKDITRFQFVQEMFRKKKGYYDLSWQNPGEPAPRLKAGYMTWFEPWEWIISAAPYKDEFHSLMDIDQFRKNMDNAQTSRTRGSYVMVVDMEGNLIYHPEFPDRSALEFRDKKTDRYFIREMLETIVGAEPGTPVNGWLEFAFTTRGSGGAGVGDKLMYYTFLPAQGWVVATLINKDEMLRPCGMLQKQLAVVGGGMLLVTAIIALLFSRYLTLRIRHLEDAADKLSNNQYDIDLNRSALDEIGDLEEAFGKAARTINVLMRDHRELNERLEEKVGERTRELSESQEELDSIFRNSQVGLLLLRGGRKLARCNQRLADIFGYRTPDEMAGIGMRQFHLSRRHYVDFGARFYNSLSHGEQIQVEYRLRRRDGGAVWCTLSGKALDKAHPPDLDKGVLWVVDDISSRKAMESEVIRAGELAEKARRQAEAARGEAEAANQSKSDFLANMSHEIRTPLNAVVGLTYLLNQQPLKEEQRKYARKIDDSSNALLGIINNILDFSKIEAGKMEIEDVDFDLHSVIENVATLVEMEALERNLEFIVSYGPEVKKALHGDPLRLGQILTNLSNNAVKFTHGGEVGIYTERTDDKMYRFEVRDTGIGISPGQQEKLFRSFSQADAGTTRKYGGTGLGLAISRQLVEMMGGRIWIDSDEGRGSSFFFELPLGEQEEGELRDVIADAFGRGGKKDYRRHGDLATLRDELTSLSGSRILLVEDNAMNREIVSGMLSHGGLTITEAHNGQRAVELFTAEPDRYELILMDIQMPEMDGYEATRRIREKDGDIPIIALTANSLLKEVRRARELGMNEYLSKPVDAEKLFGALLRFIPKKCDPVVSAGHGEKAPESKALPGFTHIDTEVGLGHMMGDRKLYIRILGNFAAQYEDTGEKLKRLIREDREGARRMAHTVKGLTANIGARALHKVAEKLDLTLDVNLIPEFNDELARVVQEIRENVILEEAPPDEGEKTISSGKLDALILELLEAVKRQRPLLIMPVLAELGKYRLPAAHAEFLKTLKPQVERYRFEDALAVLERFTHGR